MTNHASTPGTGRALRRRSGRIAVLRLPSDVAVSPFVDASPGPLEAVIRTPEETTLVRGWDDPAVADAPDEARSGPYLAWSVPGKLDFDLVGILLDLIRPLEAAGVPVLAISTFDTDWILVAEPHAEVAEDAWRSAGIVILDRPEAGAADSEVRKRRGGDL